MSKYLQLPKAQNKAEQLITLYGGIYVSQSFASTFINKPELDVAVVVVVENGGFDAAAYAETKADFYRFTSNPDDLRPKHFILMPREKAEELSAIPF